MKTTLNKIRGRSPCKKGLEKLLKHLGKTKADDEPVSIITILDSNGLDDALWCLRAVDGHEKEMRLFAVWCARQVQHLMTDPRSIAALDVAERYAHGHATDDELEAARDAAGAAALTAAWDAARDAALTASLDAARDVARGVARGAERVAARDAAWDAAWNAAWDAARNTQAQELRRVCTEIETKGEQQDIPDLIAGALGVSRGTAYDMMREALAEAPPEVCCGNYANCLKPCTPRGEWMASRPPAQPAQQEPIKWADYEFDGRRYKPLEEKLKDAFYEGFKSGEAYIDIETYDDIKLNDVDEEWLKYAEAHGITSGEATKKGNT